MTEQDGPRSPDSTVESYSHASSPARADPRSFLQQVLGDNDSQRNTPPPPRNNDLTEDEDVQTPSGPGAEAGKASTGGGVGSRKKKAPPEGPPGSATNSSIYSGNKIRHLKKDDGEPLWRKDIQYEFLKNIFENKMHVFTNSYDPSNITKQTFADLYIDAMARSSKTSKILRDKLLSEHEPAKNMAMVCLLVNLGRMNTTLNFFPEMRAQLRTYHAIPSLQAHQDPNSYKQLQDAPRLKSILKGASEDRPEPNTLDRIKGKEVPRTNPVNLIFVLAQYAPKVTELHFPPSRDFYDLIMKTSLSSKSRARAFLWLMWFYLESDFTEEGAEENPFGPGVDYDVDVRNQGVPRFKTLSEEEEALENVDTQEELEYGHTKMRERKRIIEADQAAFQAEHGPPKRGPKPKLHLPPDDGGPSTAAYLNRIRPKHEEFSGSPAGIPGRMRAKYESDMDSTRSTPPPRVTASLRGHNSLGRGRGSLKHHIDGSSPAPQSGEVIVRRSRPLTAHQLAVERNRNQRVDYILSRGLRRAHHQARKSRRREGAFFRALQRARKIPDELEDSEDEGNILRDSTVFRGRGFGGLIQLSTEEDDFGEEQSTYAAAFRRMGRRLDRWDNQKDLNLGVIGTNRAPQSKHASVNGHDTARENDETEDENRPRVGERKRGFYAGRGTRGGFAQRNKEELDDMDKELLGLRSEDDMDDDDRVVESEDEPRPTIKTAYDKTRYERASYRKQHPDETEDEDDDMDVD